MTARESPHRLSPAVTCAVALIEETPTGLPDQPHLMEIELAAPPAGSVSSGGSGKLPPASSIHHHRDHVFSCHRRVSRSERYRSARP